MSIGTIIYLAELAGDLKTLLMVLNISLFVIICALVFSIFAVFDSKYEEDKQVAKSSIKFIKYSMYVLLPSLLLYVFIPKAKTIYLMTGVSVLEDIANNKKVQDTGGKVLDLLNKKLDELNEVDNKKEK